MLLEARNVSFRYNKNLPWILKNLNFSIETTEKIAIVGPSGCGKSTLAKILAGYIEPTEGEVFLDGKILEKNGYSKVQLIHQHPEQAVNPRWKMAKIIREGCEPSKETLEAMGIEKEWLTRWPNELSGGELQRFCIARVLNEKTKFLLCDEISTMLDVITQAQIWKIIREETIDKKYGLLVVTHNMALAEKVCDKIIRLKNLQQEPT